MPKKIDWYYHRNGCTTCKRAQGFLEGHDIIINEMVIANKNKLGPDDALRLASEVSRIVVAKGRKVITFDMKKDPPDNETLLKAMLGPTGNLRAPTVKRGRTLFVGFDEGAYGAAFV